MAGDKLFYAATKKGTKDGHFANARVRQRLGLLPRRSTIHARRVAVSPVAKSHKEREYQTRYRAGLGNIGTTAAIEMVIRGTTARRQDAALTSLDDPKIWGTAPWLNYALNAISRYVPRCSSTVCVDRGQLDDRREIHGQRPCRFQF